MLWIFVGNIRNSLRKEKYTKKDVMLIYKIPYTWPTWIGSFFFFWKKKLNLGLVLTLCTENYFYYHTKKIQSQF